MIQKGNFQKIIQEQKNTAKSINILRNNIKAQQNTNRVKKTDYLLYAQCLILQLEQEHSYKVLKKQFLAKQIVEIQNLLKKCRTDTKIECILKLLNLVKAYQIEITQEIFSLCEELINYLSNLSNVCSQKIVDYVAYERLDIILVFLYNIFKEKKVTGLPIFHKIVTCIRDHSDKIKKKMTKQQNRQLIENILMFDLKKRSIQSKRKNSKLRTFYQSNDNRVSSLSIISNKSQNYIDRLLYFDEGNQLIDFKKTLEIFSNSVRKKTVMKTLKRPSTKINKTAKRISNSWNKNILSTFNNISNPINASLKVTQQKSNQKIFRLKSGSQANEGQNLYQSKAINLKNKISALDFQPFYFFTYINGFIKCNTVTNVISDEIGSMVKLVVFVQGYFTQKIILKKSFLSINFEMNSDQVAEFILKNIVISKGQKGIWEALRSKIFKNTEDRRTQIKNILFNDSTTSFVKTFCGFLSLENVKFFGKFIQQPNQQNGNFLLLDKNCENIVQNFKATKKKADQFFQKILPSQENDQIELFNYDASSFSVVEKNMEMDFRAIHQIRANYREKSIKQKDKNQFYSVTKVNGKYRLVSHKIKKNKNSLLVESTRGTMSDVEENLNIQIERKINGKQSLGQELKSLQEHFLSQITKNGNQQKSIIGRRAGFATYSSIEFQFSFLQKIKSLEGYFVCKFIFFKCCTSDLVLFELYQSGSSKYFQIEINPMIAANFFPNSRKNISKSDIWLNFSNIKKDFEIGVCNVEQSCNQLMLYFEWKGSRSYFRELLVRQLSESKNKNSKNTTLIHCMYKIKEEISPVPSLIISLEEESFFVRKKIHKFGGNVHEFVRKDILQNRYKYSQLIKFSKETIKKSSQLKHTRDLNSFYFFLLDEENPIVNISQKDVQWNLTIHRKDKLQSYNIQLQKLLGKIGRNLKGNCLKRILKRTLQNKVSTRLIIV